MQTLDSAQVEPKKEIIPEPKKPELEVIKKIGRPFEITDEVVRKLEQAFSIGATVREALIYADIPKSTYYDFLKTHPELSDYFEQLREKPILKARNNIASAIEKGDPETSRWYLERKKKDEFSTRSELTGKGGEGIKINVIDYDGRQRDSNTTQLRPGAEALPAGSVVEPRKIQVASYPPKSGQNGAVDQQNQSSGS